MQKGMAFLVIVGLQLVSAGPYGAWAEPSQPHGNRVQQWGLFEVALANRRAYQNPFTDVVLQATLRTPGGDRVSTYGFYDGGNIWRLRYMPDQPGTWGYDARFSDGEEGVSGSFQCIGSRKHGPLRVRVDNPLWFQHADGTPFYMQAFHLWNVEALKPDVLERTLDFLARQYGFNTIVGPHLLPPDRLPWKRRADGGVDFTRFNLDVWRSLDRVLSTLERRGMVLIPFNVFGGTNGMPVIPTEEDEERFLRYWTARWGGYWNATYQPTSEWEEGFSEAHILRVGQRLQQLDGGRHLISVHALQESSERVQRSSWFSYHTVQDKLTAWDPQKYARLVAIHRRVPKPILAHECLWEGNFYQKEAGLDEDNMRRAAWTIALSGGQINYADEVVPPRQWQRRGDVNRTFSELGCSMKPQGRLYGVLRAIGDCLRSVAFWRLRPDPELSSSGLCLADPGRLYVTYSPANKTLTMDLRASPGTLSARWLDPCTGRSVRHSRVLGGGVREIEPAGTGDWLVILRR